MFYIGWYPVFEGCWKSSRVLGSCRALSQTGRPPSQNSSLDYHDLTRYFSVIVGSGAFGVQSRIQRYSCMHLVSSVYQQVSASTSATILRKTAAAADMQNR